MCVLFFPPTIFRLLHRIEHGSLLHEVLPELEDDEAGEEMSRCQAPNEGQHGNVLIVVKVHLDIAEEQEQGNQDLELKEADMSKGTREGNKSRASVLAINFQIVLVSYRVTANNF